MKILVTGSRTFGELEYEHARRGEGKQDPYALTVVLSFLDGLWTEGTVGYLVVDMIPFTIIEGGCPTGVDRIARWWAKESPMHGHNERESEPPFIHIPMDADWSLGRGAGPKRNGEMIEELMKGDPDEERLVVAFVDKPIEESTGTNGCIEKAKAAGVAYTVTEFHGRT